MNSTTVDHDKHHEAGSTSERGTRRQDAAIKPGLGEEPALPNQRARQKARTRRRHLIAATRELIENGPATASLGAIAERAGVSRPTLFFHFRSRDELMRQVGLFHMERYGPSFRRRPGLDFRSYLESYVRANRSPFVRLMWHLGDVTLQGRLIPAAVLDHPEGPQGFYGNLMSEIELRLVDAGLAQDTAHERAAVLVPGLLMVSRRVAQDLSTDAEINDFVNAASRFALSPPEKQSASSHG